MNASTNPILVGVIAGLFAAILMAASAYVPFASLVLLAAAMTSIFTAGIGFGLASCLIAIATASVANAVLYSSPQSLFFTAVPLLPAAAMGYLANLGRPAGEIGGPDAATAWFPLSDILLAGAALTAVATIATLAMNPNMEQIYLAVAEAATQMMAELNPDVPADPALKDQTIGVLRTIWPMIQSAQMLIALFAGFYFAVRILSTTGRTGRPREDIPSSLRMNRLAIAVFLAGLALTLIDGPLSMVGASFAGAVAGGFLLSGFAIIHNAVRGKTWALPGLVLIYILTLFFLPVIGVLIIIAGGLANPRRAIALTPNKPDTTQH
jgi:hypothetical protein